MKERKRIYCLWAGNWQKSASAPLAWTLLGWGGEDYGLALFKGCRKEWGELQPTKKIFLAHIGGRTDMEWETLNQFDGQHTKKEDWVNAAQVEFYVVVFWKAADMRTRCEPSNLAGPFLVSRNLSLEYSETCLSTKLPYCVYAHCSWVTRHKMSCKKNSPHGVRHQGLFLATSPYKTRLSVFPQHLSLRVFLFNFHPIFMKKRQLKYSCCIQFSFSSNSLPSPNTVVNNDNTHIFFLYFLGPYFLTRFIKIHNFRLERKSVLNSTSISHQSSEPHC